MVIRLIFSLGPLAVQGAPELCGQLASFRSANPGLKSESRSMVSIHRLSNGVVAVFDLQSEVFESSRPNPLSRDLSPVARQRAAEFRLKSGRKSVTKSEFLIVLIQRYTGSVELNISPFTTIRELKCRRSLPHCGTRFLYIVGVELFKGRSHHIQRLTY